MAAPASTLVITNISSGSIWANGVQMAPQATQNVASANMAGACSDSNLRVNFWAGNISLTVNGQTFTNASNGAQDLLDGIAAGSINL